MTAVELLAEARARGAEFTLAGSGITCRHPGTAGLPALLKAISSRKAEAIAILRWQQGLGAGLGAGRVVAISRGYHARLLRCAAERRCRGRDSGRRVRRRPLFEAAQDEIRAATRIRIARPRVIAVALACRDREVVSC